MVNTVKRTSSLVLLLALILGVVFTAQSQEANTASFRFVHVLPGSDAVDIYVDGELSIVALAYGEATNYMSVTPENHAIAVTQTGVSEVLWTQSVEGKTNAATTLVVSSAEALAFTAFNEDLNTIELGKARFTAINAIADLPSVDIILADGRPVVPGLQYNQPYGTLDLPALSYDLAVIPAGGVPADAILPTLPFSLNNGTSYILVAYGSAVEPQQLMLMTAARSETADSGLLRVAHVIADAANVDIYVDGTLIVPSLAFGIDTGFVNIASGTVEFEARLIGSQIAIASAELNIETGSATSVYLVGDSDTPNLLVLPENTQLISPETAVFSLVNASSDGTTVSAAFADADALTGEVETQDAESVILEPSTSALNVAVTANDETTTTALNLGTIYGGVLYSTLVIEGTEGTEVISLRPAEFAQSPVSAPGDGLLLQTATPEPTTNAVINEGSVVVVTDGPTAQVVLNQGANLQLRLYPSPDALSLGLAPAGATFSVLGREGAPAGEEDTFDDPALDLEDDEDLEAADTWVNIIYNTPDGGAITAWVNARYLTIRAAQGGLQRLANLPTVPSTQAGSSQNTAIQSPPLPDRAITVFSGNMSADARVHIRRTPDTLAESLALIPPNTEMAFLGTNDAEEWYFVRYTASDAVVTGWINAEFAPRLVQLGRDITIERLIELEELIIIEDDERGGVVSTVGETNNIPAELRDVVVGTVINLNAGANLHLRQIDDITGESLVLIPTDAILIVDAQNVDGTWLRATYEDVVGWVFATYVDLTFNGVEYDLNELPLIDTSS